MENNFSQIQTGAEKLLTAITDKVTTLDKEIGELNEKVAKFLNVQANSSGLQNQIKTLESEVAKLMAVIEKQKKQVQDLSNIQKKASESSIALAEKAFKAEQKKEKQMDSMYRKRESEINKDIALEKKRQAEIDKAFAKEQSRIDKITNLEKKAQAQRELQVKKESDLRERLSKQKEREIAQNQNKINAEKRAQVERENQVKKESDLRERLARQREKEEKDNFNNLRKAGAEAKKNEEAQKRLSNAYLQLVDRQRKSGLELKNLIVLYGKNSVQVKNAQREYNRLTSQVNQANKATSNFANTGLGSVARGFRSLLGAFGIVGGVMLFADFVRATITTIKELDKLDFTLKAVLRNEGELARTKEFLTQVSLRYGVEIIATTERYTKFMVASRQAGLTLKQVEHIFGTFAETAAVLGLKTHELEGIFLALEQMFSKGKVTTEELRRQLGERLPGAFDLMAKALNVSTKELDRMLRAGEVLSKDAIPKLTEEVRKFYNLTGAGVDTLQASTQKLSTSWTLLIDTLNKSTGIGNIWKDVLDTIASGIRNVSKAFGSNIIEAETKAMADYSKELQDTDRGTEHYLTTIQDLRKEQEKIGEEHDLAKKQLEDLKVPMFGLIEDYEKEKEALEKTIGATNGKYKAIESYIDLLKKQGDTEKKSLINTIITFKDKNDIIDTSLDLVKLEVMTVKELKDAYNGLITGQAELGKYTIPYYEEMIKNNEELRKTLKSTNVEDIKKVELINQQNKEYQRQIDILNGKQDGAGGSKKDRETERLLKAEIKLQKDAAKARNEAIQSSLDIEINANKAILEDDEKNGIQRFIAMQEFEDLSNQSALKQSEYEIEIAKLTNDEIQRSNLRTAEEKMTAAETLNTALISIDNEYQDALKQNAVNRIKDFDEITKSELEKQQMRNEHEFALIEQGYDNQKRLAYKNFNEGKALLDNSLKNKIITQKVYDDLLENLTQARVDEIARIEREAAIESLKLAIFLAEKQAKLEQNKLKKQALEDEITKSKMALDTLVAENAIANNNATIDSTQRLLAVKNELRDFLQGFQDELFSGTAFDKMNEFFLKLDENGNSMFDNLLAGAEPGLEKFQVYFNTISEVAQEAFNVIAQSSKASFDAQYEALEKQKEIALQFAGDSAAAKERIEEQYEEKRRRIQKKQAEAEKKQAMFNILINTAQAVVATLGKTGFFGIPLAAIVGALGAAQLAIVAATPVPEFFRGTENAPEGWAKVDEKRPEVHTDRQGNIKSMGEDKPNYRYLASGDKIYRSHEEWIKKEFGDVMQGNDIVPYSESLSQMPVVIVKDNGLKANEMDMIMRRHFSNLKTNNTVIDKNGIKTFISNGHGRTINTNNRVTHKGISV